MVTNTYCVVFFVLLLFVLYAQCCQFFWIAHSWLSLRFSLTFIVFVFLWITWHFHSPSRAFIFVIRDEQSGYVVRSIEIVTNTYFIRWRKPECPYKAPHILMITTDKLFEVHLVTMEKRLDRMHWWLFQLEYMRDIGWGRIKWVHPRFLVGFVPPNL